MLFVLTADGLQYTMYFSVGSKYFNSTTDGQQRHDYEDDK